MRSVSPLFYFFFSSGTNSMISSILHSRILHSRLRITVITTIFFRSLWSRDLSIPYSFISRFWLIFFCFDISHSLEELLDNKIRFLQENLSGHPEVEVTYFQVHTQKSGGAYVTVRGRLEKIDVYSCCMVFTDQTALALDNIFAIEGEVFGGMDELSI